MGPEINQTLKDKLHDEFEDYYIKKLSIHAIHGYIGTWTCLSICYGKFIAKPLDATNFGSQPLVHPPAIRHVHVNMWG